MISQLDQLKKITKIVADTGDLEEIETYNPIDATTNPSLIYQAAQLTCYKKLLFDSINYAKIQLDDKVSQIHDAIDWLSVAIGKKLQSVIKGDVSTEVDANLSFDTQATVKKAKKIVSLYKKINADPNRLLIKIAGTWEGIQAAKILEKQGIRCNLTLIFNINQALASAQAGAFLISPFVGRIYDWFKNETNKDYTGDKDPGVISVSNIYYALKKRGYRTIVMGASFRNIDQIRSLAGCDCLTISPTLLEELRRSTLPIKRKLFPTKNEERREDTFIDEARFRWLMNQDSMATIKLSEGIRQFSYDQLKLQKLINSMVK